MVLAVIAGIAALNIFIPRTLSGFLGPQVFPLVVVAALIVLGLILVIRSLIRPRHAKQTFGSLRDVVVLCGAIVLYLVLFQVLGFTLSTFLLLTGMFLYLGERKLWVSALIAAVLSVLIMLAFRNALNVALPLGPFGF